MTQLAALARKFPARVIHERVVGGGRSEDYVSHAVVTEKLLAVCGPFSWELRTLPDGHVIGTLTLEIDGRTVTVSGVGEGDDLKKAESDALKRAAMRAGVGLHLWSGADYALDRALRQDDDDE